MRTVKKRGWPTRCYVIEFLGDNRAKFECKEGHTFKTKMFPPAPNGKVPGDDLLRKFARYWGKPSPQDGGGGRGVTMECPKCKREKNAHVAQPFRQIVNAFVG